MKKLLIFNFQFSTEEGFTLIELLLVLAIIGVLTTFLLANLIGARARARDAQRKSDISQIQSALELYRADQNNYPDPNLISCGASLDANSTTYMRKIPCDPLTKTGYNYSVTGGGTGYTLIGCLENGNDSGADKNQSGGSNNSNACAAGTFSYTVTNP